MDCEIKYIGTTESTSIPYISVQLTCTTATTSYHQKMFLNNKYFQKNVPLRHLISPPRKKKTLIILTYCSCLTIKVMLISEQPRSTS